MQMGMLALTLATAAAAPARPPNILPIVADEQGGAPPARALLPRALLATPRLPQSATRLPLAVLLAPVAVQFPDVAAPLSPRQPPWGRPRRRRQAGQLRLSAANAASPRPGLRRTASGTDSVIAHALASDTTGPRARAQA